MRMRNQGFLNYFKVISNYTEFLYVIFSISMTIDHILTPPQYFEAKLLMIFVIALSIARTFKQMRIMEVFAHIVEMLF